MKIKIISADIIYDENYHDEGVINSVVLKWQETDGIIMKKKFTYNELHNNQLIFRAFKHFHSELYI